MFGSIITIVPYVTLHESCHAYVFNFASFSAGSVAIKIVMQTTLSPLSTDEKLALSQQVVNSLTAWNGTLALNGETVAIIGDITGSSDSGECRWLCILLTLCFHRVRRKDAKEKY